MTTSASPTKHGVFDPKVESSSPIVTVPRSRPLRLTWLLLFGSFAISFPLCMVLVFEVGFDRRLVGSIMSVNGCIAYLGGFAAAFLPYRSLRNWTPFQRLTAAVLTFMISARVTNLTWELPWLFTHPYLPGHQKDMWAYPWYVYIDGGDTKYLTAPANLVALECISVTNACIAVTGLILLFRSKYTNSRGTLLLMSAAVVDLTITIYYYLREIIGGFPSVNTSNFVDLWVKFIVLNGLWLVAPWFTLIWGWKMLNRQFDFMLTGRRFT
ncbi:hypothetical protein A5753_22890 [Mycobacterium sp. 852002-51971_SCH5477799-a]|nr:hypothetical protein A5753_22890 [Mycobacterium sp. 852002-51971_SCH5477799-a]